MPTLSSNVGWQQYTGKHLLRLSSSRFDPLQTLALVRDPDGIGGFVAVDGMPEGLGQPRHLAVVKLGPYRVDAGAVFDQG
jgi:hypothetical protein